MLIKINHLKYIELLAKFPNWDMEMSGWDYEEKLFLGIIPYIVYTKTWRK